MLDEAPEDMRHPVVLLHERRTDTNIGGGDLNEFTELIVIVDETHGARPLLRDAPLAESVGSRTC